MASYLIEKYNIEGINWDSVLISGDFMSYLNICDLQEVSLLSKFVRYKLKPKLFESIKFNGRCYKNYFVNENNLFSKYFKMSQDYFNEIGDSYDFWTLKVDPAFKELEDQLVVLKHYVKKFSLTDVGTAGCYLLPIIKIFDKLTTLKLSSCIISLAEFAKLIESLPNLESIKLIYVTFARLPTNDAALNDINYPTTLNQLLMYEVLECTNKLLLHPHELLIDNSDNSNYVDFLLPQISIPSISTISLMTSNSKDNGLNKFLSYNSQLKEITIGLANLDQFKLDYIQNSTTLKKLVMTCDKNLSEEVNIPILNSVTQLHLICVNIEFCSIMKKLCISSPNLNQFGLTLDVNQDFVPIMNFLITDIISKTHKLKELIIMIFGVTENHLNFVDLNNVEKLTIQSELNTIFNINFLNSKSLKFIEFQYFESCISLDSIKSVYSHINNWRFNFTFGTVKGYKILQ